MQNNNSKPHLTKINGLPTLMVDNHPFVILGGEIHNSSASNLTYLENEVWPNLRGMHLNTVVLPVYWECLEPKENHFDYHLVDGIINAARTEGLKLVILWFGLWKNANSSYVPSWIKQDKITYFPARCNNGEPLPVISPLCEAAVQKDARAFRSLMEHIRDIDQDENTVLMVQIENEIGLLKTDRDYGPTAQEEFCKEIPAAVAAAFSASGSWEDAFGENAGEYFSAFYFAKAVEQIAAAGKQVYELPYYVNAWLEQFPWRAGSYPSGGPIIKMQKMWQLAAPSISFLAPDIYVPYAPKVMDEYTRFDNALFIPEVRKDAIAATYALYAVGGCHAIGFSPFGIEELQMAPEKIEKIPLSVLASLNIDPTAFDIEGSAKYLAKSYDIINQILPLYFSHRGTNRLKAFIRKSGEELGTVLSFPNCDLIINYMQKERFQPDAGGIVIQVSENTFYLLGTKYYFQFLPKIGIHQTIEYLSVEEGYFEDEIWHCQRLLNGDEKMRLEFKDMPKILKISLNQF